MNYTLPHILAAVAFGFSVPAARIQAPGKTVSVASARIAFYRMARAHTDKSNREIAEHVCRTDPGTARSGSLTAEDLIETDATFRRQYELAQATLMGSRPVSPANYLELARSTTS
jgi:chromosomal replication initiation ATPase DnaA